MIELVVPGKARGKGRPRFDPRSGRAYTDKQTQSTEQLIQAVWMAVGRPYLGDVPLSLELEIVVARPQSHYLKSGGLSTAGVRATDPVRKPDCDNALKLAMDACNGIAYKDDVQVVTAKVWRRWASRDEQEHTVIRIRPLQQAAEEALAA